MDKEHLIEQLEVLQQELATLDGNDKVDDLQELVENIQQELSAEPESLSDKMDLMVSEFDAEHPTVAGLIRDISAKLSNLGI